MKRLLILLALLILAVPAHAATTLQFTWDANPPEEQISGYRLYMDCGGPECMVLQIQDPLATSCSYTVEDKLNHAFSLTAYRMEDGEMNESEHSDYAIYAVRKTPVPKPRMFKLITR